MSRKFVHLLLLATVGLVVWGAGLLPAAADPTVVDTVSVGHFPEGVVGDWRTGGTDFVYVVNSGDDSVWTLNPWNHAFADAVTVGCGPAGVDVGWQYHRVYVANNCSHNVSVIDGHDPFNLTFVGTVNVSHFPWAVVADPQSERAYVDHNESNLVTVIDGLQAVATIEAGPPGSNMSGMAIRTGDPRMIYAASFKPSDGHSEVAVINGNTNAVVGHMALPTYSIPWGVTIDTYRERVYVANYGQNNVSVFDRWTNTEIDTDGNPANGITRIPVGTHPRGIVFNPYTERVYVANSGGTVSVIDALTYQVVATVPVGSSPWGVSFSHFQVYVSNEYNDTVSVIDDAAAAFTRTPTPASTATPTPTAIPTATPTSTPTSDVDTDGDGLKDYEEIALGTSPLLRDTDGDGCAEPEELAGAPAPKAGATGPYDPLNPYDFYDVPAPAYPDMTANGSKNGVVDIADALAVMFYAFAQEGGGPNGNGVSYDSVKGSCDWNADTVPDKEGLCYDRQPSSPPNPPVDAGPPSGVIDIGDALAVLAQFGLDCSGPP